MCMADKLKGRLEQRGITVTAGYAISCDLYKRRLGLRKFTAVDNHYASARHHVVRARGLHDLSRPGLYRREPWRGSKQYQGFRLSYWTPAATSLGERWLHCCTTRRIVGPSPSLQGFGHGLDPALYSSIREAGSRSSSRCALMWHDEDALILHGDRASTPHHGVRNSDWVQSSDNPFLPGDTFPGMRTAHIPVDDRRYAPPAPTVKYVYLPHPEPSQGLQMCNSRGCNELTSGLLRKDQVTRRGSEEIRSPVEYVSSMCGNVSENVSSREPV